MAQACLNPLWSNPTQAPALVSQDAVALPPNQLQTEVDPLVREIYAALAELDPQPKTTSASNVKLKMQSSKSGRKKTQPYPKRKPVGTSSTHGRTSKCRSNGAATKRMVPNSSVASTSTAKASQHKSCQADQVQSTATMPNSKPVSAPSNSTSPSLPLTNLGMPVTLTIDAHAFLSRGFDSLISQLFPNTPTLEHTARISIYKPLFLELITPQLSQINTTSITDLVSLFLNSLRSLQLI